MRRRREILASLSGVGTVLIAGCGTDGDDTPSTESSAEGGDSRGTSTPRPGNDGAEGSGTRIRAPLLGSHVSGLAPQRVGSAEVRSTVAAELKLPERMVRSREDIGSIEVVAGDVTADEFASALDAAGFDVDSRRVRSSVTDATRSTVVDGLRRQLDDVNEYSGAVRTDGGHVVVELSDTGPEAARRFVTRSRSVELVAEVTDDGSETATTTIFTGEEIREIGNVQSRQGAFTVPLTFTDSGAERFETEIDQLGFTAESGIQNCGRTGSGGTPSGSYCLLWMVGDEVVTAHGMARGLANAIADGSWGENPRITVGSSSESGAREIRHVLLTGDLPTTLDLDAPATDVSRFDA